MNVGDVNPATRESEGQDGGEENASWHKRLRLRKGSSSSLTEQNTVKEEKNVTNQERGRRGHRATERSKKPPQSLYPVQTVEKSKHPLTFTCSVCKNSPLFSNNDLMVHFKTVHEGKGSPPVFPCEMCSFSTPVFTTLTQHRMKHKDCLFTCDICNDNVQHRLPQLTKHCQTHHTLNGQYHCQKCKLTVNEIEQLLCHTCQLNTVPIKTSHEESITNGTLASSLLADAAGSTHKDNLQHMAAADGHRRWSRRNWWRKREPALKTENNLSQDFKFLLPKAEPQWGSPAFQSFPAAGLLDDQGVLLDAEKTLEETQQFLERTISSGKTWSLSLKTEQDLASLTQSTPSPSQPNAKLRNTPHPNLSSAGKDKLTGLMEKNNISVPPDCTTKVVGFKMVDGKKHLIVKVIPSTKQEASSPRSSARESAGVESGSERTSDQIQADQDQSNKSSGRNAPCSHTRMTSRRVSPQAEEQRNTVCKDHRDFLSSVAEKENSHSQHTDHSTHISDSGKQDNLNVADHQITKDRHLCNDVTSDFNTDSTSSTNAKSSTSNDVCAITEEDIQSSHEQRLKDCQEKALGESVENSTTSQADSGCHSDLASSLSSDAGSLEERLSSKLIPLVSEKEQNHLSYSNIIRQGAKEDGSTIPPDLCHLDEQEKQPNADSCQESCSISEFDCISPTTRFPLKDLTESLYHFPSEDGEVLFHSSGDEFTNNTSPRDSPVPVGQYNCERLAAERESHSTPDLYQTVNELPVTTVSHLLDGVRADVTLSTDNSTNRLTSDEPLKSSVCTGGTNQLSEPVRTDILSALDDDCNSSKSKDARSRKESISEPSVPFSPLNEPGLNRKRMGELSLNDSQGPVSKSQKRSTQGSEETEVTASLLHWEPAPPDVPKTLRLLPFSYSQPVKIPHDNQPVIVLNHPDSDVPEVTNIMRVVRKHKGAVQRVVLSKKTLRALSEFHCDTFRNNPGSRCHSSHCRREWPNETVKEKFSLKLRLKRICGKKYTVVPAVPESFVLMPTFRCWFCGRLFRDQEVWVGHGQRHLMEATRDWNKLFKR